MTTQRALALVAVSVLASPLAFAQPDSGENKPWRLGEALGLPEGVRIEGAVRPRYEAVGNPFVAGRTDDDEMLSLQSTLRIEADLGRSGLTLGAELYDSRFLTGNESGGAAAEINTFEPLQAYLSWRPRNFLVDGAKLDLTAGRFSQDLGSRRLLARAGYRNLIASFDGVKAVWTGPDKFMATLAWLNPTVREPSDALSALDNEVALDRQLGNINLSLAHIDAPLPHDLRGELYVFDLDEDDDADAATRNRDLLTFGGRLRKLPAKGQFDFEAEYAHQTGSVRATANPADATPLDHEAHMLHAEVGYSFDAPWSPRLAVQYDQASGDKSPTDNGNQRFDFLYGDRAFEFGPSSLFGFIARTNLSSPGIRLEVKPDALSDAYLMARDVRLDQARDSLGGSNVRDATGASGKEAGLQLEGRYRRWLLKDSLRISIGAARVFRGDFLKTAPNATHAGDPVYGFTELTWTF